MSQVAHKREIEQIDEECFVYWIHLEEHTDMYSQGYIGVSNDPAHRLKQHRHNIKRSNYDNPHLARAFEKYADRLIQSVVFSGSKTECYEQEEVLRHKKNIGWNVNKGGACPPSWEGKNLSDEHRKAISAGKTGKQRGALTEEHKKNMSAALKGRKLTEEHKQKVKDKRKYQIFTEATRKKLSEAKTGKTSGNAKQVQTPLGIFQSATHAAKAHQVSLQTMINWAGSDSPSKSEFRYIKNKI